MARGVTEVESMADRLGLGLPGDVDTDCLRPPELTGTTPTTATRAT